MSFASSVGEIIKVTVDYRGSKFDTFYNKTKKYYYCPICGSSTEAPIFFYEEDLIYHIKAHVLMHKKSVRES